MKKIFATLLAAVAMMTLGSCSSENYNDYDIDDPNSKQDIVRIYAGNTFIGQNKANTLYSKNNELGYSIPKDGTYDVWYYIRIDGNIPGEAVNTNTANQYFPQTAGGKTLTDDRNHGTVNAFAEWRASIEKKFPKYIWGTDGSAVQSIIMSEPTLEDIVNANQNSKYDLSGYLEHQDELHFIWYTCKQQTADHAWHIDGILTTKEKTDITETIYGKDQKDNYDAAGMVEDRGDVNRKGHVEVDIHQQQHKDWSEIKTSIHLRDTVDTKVFIPLPAEYQCTPDDFNIRISQPDDEYYKEQVKVGENFYNVEYNINHKEDGIEITIKGTDLAEVLKEARLNYHDGITLEVHSYSKNLSNEDLWAFLKKSTCTVSPYTSIYGQITSAYYDELIQIK